ncbi:uncharacterized protein LOC135499834 [Lineus longissimus]|uniref:uncharacterized protein LOC135499834 n=1 Tax=Lineus longissimus TaxID=88925 RepID=UPI00315DE76D
MTSKVNDANIEVQPICPICLDAPATLKVGTTCNHVFCRNCLINHLKRAHPTNDKFSCPTCQVECPLPTNGIDGLMAANTIHSERATGTAVATLQSTPNESGAEGDRAFGGESDGQQCCQICKFTKNTSIDADKICPDCCNLHLCKECISVHRKNENTKHHQLIPFRPKNAGVEGRCAAHGQWITSYCCTCSTPVCRVCVHIAHGEHTLKSSVEVFHEKIEEVRSKKEEQERRLKMFSSRENALKGLGCLSVERKDTLVKAVEDQAEKCVEQITNQKEELKERIEADFKPILQLTACVDTIPLYRTKMCGLVAEVGKLLSSAEPCLPDLDKLSSIGDRIDETSKLTEEKNGDENDYLVSYSELWQKLPAFVPRVTDCNFGSMATTGKKWGIDCCKLIFEEEPQSDDKAKFIPCVTALGNDLYAVGKSNHGGEPADAIDVYRYPGVHQLSIREHAGPAYDMAATSDGKLAVLSDGTTKNYCCVKLFDPTAGYLRSSKNLDVRGWLSFDINIHHQFVILSNDGNRKVTIFNEDGTVVLRHSIDVNDYDIMNTACRIACSIRHIYVMGKQGLAIYQLEECGLTLVKVSNGSISGASIMADISASCFDRLAFCYINNDNSRIVTYNSRELLNRSLWKSKIRQQGGNMVARISVRGDYVVSSQGATIRVFQYVS